MISPFVMSRIHQEIAEGNKVSVDRGMIPLEFVFCTPSVEECNELLAVHDYVESLGHKLQVHCGPLEELEDVVESFDFYMTAGNSYGHMTGGFDGALAARFPGLQKAVVASINRFHNGELNVGAGAVVPFSTQAGIKSLLYTPTMRVPRRLPKGSDAPYLATRQALRMLRFTSSQEHTGTHGAKVLGCLMGTGTGVIPARTAVAQFCIALHNFTQPSNVEKLFKDGQRIEDAIRATWTDNLWHLKLSE